MQFTPYLNFDGNCREAFAFYKDLFKGTVVHQSTFGEIPPDPQNPPIPPEAKDRLMHVHLQVGAQALMGSDTLHGASDVRGRRCQTARPVGVDPGGRCRQRPARV